MKDTRRERLEYFWFKHSEFRCLPCLHCPINITVESPTSLSVIDFASLVLSYGSGACVTSGMLVKQVSEVSAKI